MRRCLFVMLSLLTMTAHGQAIYKCPQKDGTTAFQDSPCPGAPNAPPVAVVSPDAATPPARSFESTPSAGTTNGRLNPQQARVLIDQLVQAHQLDTAMAVAKRFGQMDYFSQRNAQAPPTPPLPFRQPAAPQSQVNLSPQQQEQLKQKLEALRTALQVTFAQNAAIDQQIPAVCLKIVETKLACLENKQAVDRDGGNSTELLSDRVQLTQAEQDRTVVLHNAIVLRGVSATEQQCKQWAPNEIESLTGTLIPRIHAKGGDTAPCERAVQALRDTLTSGAHEPVPVAAQSEALSPDECDRLVRRSLFNLTFKPSDPLKAKFIATCIAGRDYYTRSYFNCVFAAKYSDAMGCAYAARGLARTKDAPELADRQAGDRGLFQSSVPMMIAAIYKDKDPHTTLDQITRDRYLSERDNILKSLGESPPADGHVPFRSSNSKITTNNQTYWVVREDFHDLQLVKIEFADPKGTDAVICARLGSTEKLLINKGLCAALITKHFHTELSE